MREEIEHVRRGKHGARSAKQAIAIGLSKARRAGVPLPAPRRGDAPERTRRSATRDLATGQKRRRRRAPSAKQRAAATRALKRAPKGTTSRSALSRQAKEAARRRRRRGAATQG